MIHVQGKTTVEWYRELLEAIESSSAHSSMERIMFALGHKEVKEQNRLEAVPSMIRLDIAYIEENDLFEEHITVKLFHEESVYFIRKYIVGEHEGWTTYYDRKYITIHPGDESFKDSEAFAHELLTELYAAHVKKLYAD